MLCGVYIICDLSIKIIVLSLSVARPDIIAGSSSLWYQTPVVVPTDLPSSFEDNYKSVSIIHDAVHNELLNLKIYESTV